MSRAELTTAAEHLETAAAHAEGERRDRIESQAESLTDLADRDRGPDQGRLDRHMNVLRELSAEDDEASEHVRDALDHVEQYRSTVGGI
ncbi:hypothetical protein ACFPYI_06750 [Halomarina salina]|uniref:Uncharacterized protein n=1 Tax=Halomarina salina TaxID=1872699 RepID=A0ABD5RKM1_9EURY|nr:hypothetical protein [Halomarina salina]